MLTLNAQLFRAANAMLVVISTASYEYAGMVPMCF